MKVLLASAVLVFSTMVSAATVNFNEGDKGLTLLTEGKVTVTPEMPACPKIDMCDPVAVLRIQFDLGGCLDTLGPVTMTYVGQTAEGKKKYVVTAYKFNNIASTYTKCIRQPTATAAKVIGIGFLGNDSVEIEFTKSLVQTSTP